MQEQFDPRSFIRQLEDGSDYLDLKWRLLWLRSEHPDARVETQLVPGADDEIICRASITFRENNGGASAHGSARHPEDESPVEAAEDRALARALAALGYGTEYIADDAVESGPALTPPVSLMTARSLMEQTNDEDYDSNESAPEPAPDTEQPEPATPQSPSPALTPASEQPATQGSDYSWTKFWEWARARGYKNAGQLNNLLGIDDVTAHTPLEVRRMLKKYEMEHPPGEDEE